MAINWRERNYETILQQMVKEGWNPYSDNIEAWYLQYNSYLDCECMYCEDGYVHFYTPVGFWCHVPNEVYDKYCENQYFDYINDYWYTWTVDDAVSNILWSMDSKGLLHNQLDGYDGYTKNFSVVYNCNTLQLARYIRKLKRLIRKNKLKVTNENLWKNHGVCTIETHESYWRIYY
jgi:hypothetical protein